MFVDGPSDMEKLTNIGGLHEGSIRRDWVDGSCCGFVVRGSENRF